MRHYRCTRMTPLLPKNRLDKAERKIIIRNTYRPNYALVKLHSLSTQIIITHYNFSPNSRYHSSHQPRSCKEFVKFLLYGVVYSRKKRTPVFVFTTVATQVNLKRAKICSSNTGDTQPTFCRPLSKCFQSKGQNKIKSL